MRRVLQVLMPLEWLVLLFGFFAVAVYSLLGRPLPDLYAALNLPLPHLSGVSDSAAAVATGGAAIKFGLPFLLLFTLSIENYAFILLIFILFSALKVVHERRWRRSDVSWSAFGIAVLQRISLAQLLQDFRFLSATVIMFAEFAILKNLIPHVSGGSWDQWLIASDRLLCGGKMCSEVLLSWFGAGALESVSGHYLFFFRYLSLVATFFVVAVPRKITQECLCALIAAYLFGVLWVYGMPSTGPVFVHSELYLFMADGQIAGLQRGLLESQGQVYLISGLPSLHVAVVVIGSIFLWKVSRLLAGASWAFTLLTINSTVYLGWHYVLDDVAAVMLAFGVVWLARACSWKWAGYRDGGLFLRMLP